MNFSNTKVKLNVDDADLSGRVLKRRRFTLRMCFTSECYRAGESSDGQALAGQSSWPRNRPRVRLLCLYS